MVPTAKDLEINEHQNHEHDLRRDAHHEWLKAECTLRTKE
jgi:hypothetical protein